MGSASTGELPQLSQLVFAQIQLLPFITAYLLWATNLLPSWFQLPHYSAKKTTTPPANSFWGFFIASTILYFQLFPKNLWRKHGICWLHICRNQVNACLKSMSCPWAAFFCMFLAEQWSEELWESKLQLNGSNESSNMNGMKSTVGIFWNVSLPIWAGLSQPHLWAEEI